MGNRVLDLAKEYNLDSKDLLNHMKEMGILVTSHLSQLTEEEAKLVRSTIGKVKGRVEVVEKRVKPTIIRRRAKEAKPEKPAEIEEKKVEVEVHGAPEAALPFPSPEIPLEEPMEAPVEPLVEEVTAPPTPPEVLEEPVTVTAQEIPQEIPFKKEKEKRKAKERRKRSEPAKIIEMAPPKVIPLEPAPPSAAPVSPPPQMKVVPPLGKVVVPPVKVVPPPTLPTEPLEEKERPKKKKPKQEFEIISDKRPGRARVTLKKKEVLHVKEEFDEKERFIVVPSRKKPVKKVGVHKTEITVPKPIKRKIRMLDSIVVGDLAKKMGVKGSEVLAKLIPLGIMSSINQSIDIDAATLVASEFGFEVEKIPILAEEILERKEEGPKEELEPRPPVVTVMGHVDHGKTSLLDAIRETHVTDQEVGGITQHIGASVVQFNRSEIVFLDTPGHEAFTAMRARGAKVTDIVVLVVAADDGVMNQTREAIDHARAAKVPIIVAVNKIDKPNAQPERVRQELSALGLVPEEWGGDTIFCNVSAKQKTGIKELLESILLQAEVLELKANPNKKARGTIIEAKLDRGRGPVATVLIQEGTLAINDPFVSGQYSGRVRAMFDDRGNRIKKAGPSTPLEVVGFSGVPQAGEPFIVLSEDREAKEIEEYIQIKQRSRELAQSSRMSLDKLYGHVQEKGTKELNVIIKGDVHGSIEAVNETLQRLGGEKVRVNIIHSSVGGITGNDVMLAAASNAIIIGFNVRPEPRAQLLAEAEKVDIRLYNIIYELIEDIQKAMVGLLEPTRKEQILGRGEVIQLFRVPKIGTIAGTSVLEGRIVRGARVRIIRDGTVVYEGKVATLRRFQDDVKEVPAGLECGISIENYNDIKVKDVLEAFEFEEIAPVL